MPDIIKLWELENELYDSGVSPICGVDEAGRGPLAGPVCAAAVILPRGIEIEGLDDSKKLTEKKREALYDVIIEKALAYGIDFATVEEIERLNILGATYLAMNRAIAKLGTVPALALIDGNRNKGIDVPSRTGICWKWLKCTHSTALKSTRATARRPTTPLYASMAQAPSTDPLF